jgi:hypothetical protein
MCCPYFEPLELRSGGFTGGRDSGSCAVLPLGGAWTGMCRADSASPCEALDAARGALCNMGYARGACPRFPERAGGPDAVRFCIARDDTRGIQIRYVVESDHHPHQHGQLEYPHEAAALASTLPGDLLQRQAEAYLESYRQRKLEARAR